MSDHQSSNNKDAEFNSADKPSIINEQIKTEFHDGKSSITKETKFGLFTRRGILSFIFGDYRNIPYNASAILLIIIILSLIYFTSKGSDGKNEYIDKYISQTVPLITLILGYLFGKKE